MDQKGQIQIAHIAVGLLVFLIVLVVYGQVAGSVNNTALYNGQQFGTATSSMLLLVPLVLVGAAIIGTVILAFRLAQ